VKSLEKNIVYAYILTALQNAWFWGPIWVLYYLRFTDFAGIGILESVMIVALVVGEIPTGAIADLHGKVKTIKIGFLIYCLGHLAMGLAFSFTTLVLSILIIIAGGVLLSGTMEAFVYDSLLSKKKGKDYQKVLANLSSIRMLSLAVTSIIGGFLYQIFPGLPFIAVAMLLVIAVVLTFFLIEPPIDSDKFSLKNYFIQTSQGFSELFKNKNIKIVNILILTMASIVIMNDHVLIDSQLFAQGFNSTQLGIITSVIFICSAIITRFSPVIAKRFGLLLSISFTAILISISMIFVPVLGIVFGTILILLRRGIMEIFNISVSESINNNTRSKYRATTLSTYNMISNVPYVFGAFFIGYLMDLYSVNGVTAVLGGFLLVIAIISTLKFNNYSQK
jgi:MFS family permease